MPRGGEGAGGAGQGAGVGAGKASKEAGEESLSDCKNIRPDSLEEDHGLEMTCPCFICLQKIHGSCQNPSIFVVLSLIYDSENPAPQFY